MTIDEAARDYAMTLEGGVIDPTEAFRAGADWTRQTFLPIIADFYQACKSEAMYCPWCWGYISAGREEHADHCKWPAVAREIQESKEAVLQ